MGIIPLRLKISKLRRNRGEMGEKGKLSLQIKPKRIEMA
jgi:hypothetical protein